MQGWRNDFLRIADKVPCSIDISPGTSHFMLSSGLGKLLSLVLEAHSQKIHNTTHDQTLLLGTQFFSYLVGFVINNNVFPIILIAVDSAEFNYEQRTISSKHWLSHNKYCAKYRYIRCRRKQFRSIVPIAIPCQMSIRYCDNLFLFRRIAGCFVWESSQTRSSFSCTDYSFVPFVLGTIYIDDENKLCIYRLA